MILDGLAAANLSFAPGWTTMAGRARLVSERVVMAAAGQSRGSCYSSTATRATRKPAGPLFRAADRQIDG